MDVVVDLCSHAHLSVGVEKRHRLTTDHSHTSTRPAAILIAGWDRHKPAALDITVKSHLTPAILGEWWVLLKLVKNFLIVQNAYSWGGPAFL